MNLKPYYDAAVSAETAVQEVLTEMDALMQAGKKAEALELRQKLEDAKAQAKEANEIYTLMRDGSEATGQARKFVPAGKAADPAQTEAETAKVIDRAAFQALEPAKRMEFINSGGKIKDQD